MKIIFDLDENPPTQAEIDEFKKTFLASKRKTKWLFFSIIFPCLILSFKPGVVGDVSIFLFFLVLLIYHLASYTFPTENNIIKDLSIIYSCKCEYTLDLCDRFPELETYRRKVIESGRKLTNGECEMMKKYEIEKKTKRPDYFEKLHSINR